MGDGLECTAGDCEDDDAVGAGDNDDDGDVTSSGGGAVGDKLAFSNSHS